MLQPRINIRAVVHQLPGELEAGKISRAQWGWSSVVFASVRFAHPRQRMKRCESRALVIRISARFEQSQRELEMTVLDGQDQSTGSFGRTFAGSFLRLHGFVHVGAGFQQCSHNSRPTLARGEEERCES